MIPHPRIQPTVDLVVPSMYLLKIKSMYKWTCSVQTHVVQESTCTYTHTHTHTHTHTEVTSLSIHL